jgi:hypothetical protein
MVTPPRFIAFQLSKRSDIILSWAVWFKLLFERSKYLILYRDLNEPTLYAESWLLYKVKYLKLVQVVKSGISPANWLLWA